MKYTQINGMYQMRNDWSDSIKIMNADVKL